MLRIFSYKMPKRKKWLLTKEFLTDLKAELDRVFAYKFDMNYGAHSGKYMDLTGTAGFNEALKNVCAKHNVTKAIYEYSYKLRNIELFDFELVKMMLELGVVDISEEEGEPDMSAIYREELEKMESRGEIRYTEISEVYKSHVLIRRGWEHIK